MCTQVAFFYPSVSVFQGYLHLPTPDSRCEMRYYVCILFLASILLNIRSVASLVPSRGGCVCLSVCIIGISIV